MKPTPEFVERVRGNLKAYAEDPTPAREDDIWALIHEAAAKELAEGLLRVLDFADLTWSHESGEYQAVARAVISITKDPPSGPLLDVLSKIVSVEIDDRLMSGAYDFHLSQILRSSDILKPPERTKIPMTMNMPSPTAAEGLAEKQQATNPLSIARQALAAADGMERDRTKLVDAVIELTRQTPDGERTEALRMANYYADLLRQNEENAAAATSSFAMKSFWGASRAAELDCRDFLRKHIAQVLVLVKEETVAHEA